MEFLKTYFKIEERGSKVGTELLAGLTTFLAMAYILPVNSFMLSATGMPIGGVFFATAVAAAIAMLVMGLYANYPVALAPGMGLNAFFTYTIVFFYGLSWQAALAAVLISGILFFLVSISGLRKKIINAIPQGLKYAVGAGIGFFITFIGLVNAGIIVDDPATLVALGDLGHPTVLLGVFGIILVVILYSMGNKFSLIIAIVATAIIGVILGALGVDFMPAYNADAMGGLFEGTKITAFAAFSGFGELFEHPEVFGIIFALWFVDFFDTAGTLMAVGNQAGLIDEDGELIGSDRALIADSIGTMSGALLGTSNVTSYIESATGIEQGGRTGLTSVTVAVLFLLSLLVYPLLSIVNGVVVDVNDFGDAIVYSPVTAMALVMVGALMISQLKEIDWNKKEIVVPAFLTIVFMILTYSIATGIAVGFIFYPIIMVAQKRWREVNPIMYVLSFLFIIFFIISAA